MAKQIGPFSGRFVGRLGSAVGAKMKGGEYVSRTYQPQVKNPNTLRQQASRNRFKFVSGVCSILAPVLELGYARAAAGTKMYPRNVAVRDFLGNTGLVIQSEVDNIEIDVMHLPLSKRDGIVGTPSVTYTAPQGETPGQIVCANGGTIILPSVGSRLGVVYAVVMLSESGNGRVLAVKQALHNAPVAVSAQEAALWHGAKLYAFFKAVPESNNIVETAATPWKYPSETGETVFVMAIE